jgi:GTPase SAR1 family protein
LTHGQETYDSINRQYYQRADCCILVYDITNLESFNQCKTFYKQEIINNCKEGIKVILVGNKIDLEDERKVTTKQGTDFAKENGYYFKETSCEINLNVASVFETIIIMTNNDMKKSNQLNLNTKPDIEPIKLSKDDLIKENYSKKKKKKNECC